MNNIPSVKLGIISVSRDCFPIELSQNRRNAVVKAYAGEVYESKITVENEVDMLKAAEDITGAGCNALVVFLGNFGPETPETLIAQKFEGPVMYVAAAEDSGDALVDGRGDAYCGMLNCSYNYMSGEDKVIPEYPVGDAKDIAKMIEEFVPVARALIGIRNLKIIAFGPRPQDFMACNAPIQQLFNIGVEIQENSELDLLVAGGLLWLRYGPGDAPIMLTMWLLAIFFAHAVPSIIYVIFSLPGGRLFHRFGADVVFRVEAIHHSVFPAHNHDSLVFSGSERPRIRSSNMRIGKIEKTMVGLLSKIIVQRLHIGPGAKVQGVPHRVEAVSEPAEVGVEEHVYRVGLRREVGYSHISGKQSLAVEALGRIEILFVDVQRRMLFLLPVVF